MLNNFISTRNIIPLFTLIVLASCTAQPGNEDAAKEEWIQLFNGKDMTGWTPKIVGYPAGENFKNTFRVEDGALASSYDEYETFNDDFGHLFYKDKFSHYRLRVQYRFVGEQVNNGPGWAYRNNGLMLHAQPVETMGLKQPFPISLEMQLLAGSGSGERSTGNLCTPGTHVYLEDSLFMPHCVSSTSKTYHGEQWVNAEAVVLGDSIIHHIVEGDTVLTYTKPTIGGGMEFAKPEMMQEGKALAEGYITIQAESHPTQFKKMELLNLCGCMDPKAKNFKSYYIKDDRSKCQY